MEKLFDDTLFVQKDRPKKITAKQEEQMYLELANECIKYGYSNDDDDIIVNDFKQLRNNDSGFEKAKYLENYGLATYEFNGDFIDFLDSIESKEKNILKENVKLWVKAHNPQPKLEKGMKMLIVDSLNIITKELRKGSVIYVTGINMEQAYYTISGKKEKKGGYVFAFEEVESKTLNMWECEG